MRMEMRSRTTSDAGVLEFFKGGVQNFAHPANRIRNPASKALGVDLKAAARAVSDLASLRFALREIAFSCSGKPAANELSELLGVEG
jgi:hypothetical protein